MEKAVTVSQVNYPVEQIERMAHAFAKSGLFGIKTVEQGVALMLIAQAEGLHPAVAARDYHIIQGRPALKSDALLARFQAAGGKVVWNAYNDQEVSGTFSHPSGGSATVVWTISQAKTAGLTGKDVWKQYPRAMLRARVISEGIRTVFPGVSVGVYTVEEVQDFDAKPETREVQAEVTQAPIAATASTIQPKTVAPKTELFEKLKKSAWSKEQLAQYSEAFFGVGSSAQLSVEQLTELVTVATSQTFLDAMQAQASMEEEWEKT
jgi:hypothetical protein